MSSTMILAMTVEDKGNPDFNHKHITCGSYTIVYNGTTHVTKIWSVPDIAIIESNYHGGHNFMSIELENFYIAINGKIHQYMMS